MMTTTTPHTNRFLGVALLCAIGLNAFGVVSATAQDDEAVNMIIDLIKGSDPDMQGLAFQQISESLPGEATTRRFVELLPTLDTALQVKLVDALGERGDPTARPTILKMLNSDTEAMRDVAARALANVATPADIPVLAEMAATGSDLEKKAARRSLRLLPGHDMSAAMCAALEGAEAKTSIELMSALVDRKVTQAVPDILKRVDDSDLTVRLAVLAALRAMADEDQTAIIVTRLKSAQDKTERRQAAAALVATCRRGTTKCAPAVIAGFKGADAATRIALMRALLEAGGAKALNEIVARLKDKDKTVSREAVRVLTSWPDRSATVHIKTLARDVKNLRNHILAIRGLVRLASPAKGRAPDFATLKEAMTLATRQEEKVLVLGALGRIPTPDSLALVISAMDQDALAQNACLTAVLIAEKMSEDHPDSVHTAMQKVIKTAQSPKTRDRAEAVLNPPQPQASPSKQ